MDVKEFLNQYRESDRSIKGKIEQIRHLRELATRTTATLVPDKVQSSGENKLEYSVQKIVDLEREIENEIKRLIQIKRDVEGVILDVHDPVLQSILRLRYMNCLTWEQIAEEMNYSCRNVYYLSRKAIAQVNACIICTGKLK